MRDANLRQVWERVIALETLTAFLQRSDEDHRRHGERITALEVLCGEMKAQAEKRELRHRQFWLGIGLVGFTFVANLVMQFLLFISRKTG